MARGTMHSWVVTNFNALKLWLHLPQGGSVTFNTCYFIEILRRISSLAISGTLRQNHLYHQVKTGFQWMLVHLLHE